VSDYSLVPVDYPPDFENVSLVPVEHDPFIEDDEAQQAQTQQAQAQQAQTPPAPPQNQPQQPPAGVSRLYVGRPPNSTQSSAPSSGSTPQPTAPTASPDTPLPANERQSGDMPGSAPGSRVSTQIAAKIAELATDFYNQSVLKPARDLREMGHDLVTDPAYFLHAIGPSLVGLGMGAPAARAGSIGGAGRAKEIQDVIDETAQKFRTTAIHQHHPWPMYLGGAVKQELVSLPKSLHIEFHRGLDKRLPKQRGKAYYASQGPAERQQALEQLAVYIKEFDAKHGTKLYDALLRNGFPVP
jgi:hypothetical protein